MKFYLVHILKVFPCFVFVPPLKVCSVLYSCYAYILLYMYKTLPKFGNEKEQQQIKYYEKSSGELILL